MGIQRKRLGHGRIGMLTLSMLGWFGWGCADSHVLTVIEIKAPQNGAVLGRSQDQDPTADGVQFAVHVDTYGIFPGMELVLEHGTGETPSSTGLTARVEGDGTATFTMYTFPVGNNIVRVSTTDGSIQSNIHGFSVSDNEIDVSIETPADGSGLNASDDCSTVEPGYQALIVANTSAVDGSLAEVWIGGDPEDDAPTATSLVEDGKVELCLDADEGLDIEISVRVTSGEGEDALTASDSVTVSIDLTAPLTAISDLGVSYFTAQSEAAQRRAGNVTLSWTSVSGGGSGDFANLDHYVLRCASAPITSEADWDAAADAEVILQSEPQAEGSPETEAVGGFARLAVTENCALRGADAGDSLTPLVSPTASIAITNNFVTQTITAAEDMGQRATAVGDVNGDGIHDMVVNATDAAYLYYGVDGATTALSAVPDVTFISDEDVVFATAAVGIGDFNGDGRDDFALADANEATPNFGGAVYIIYGRSDSDGPAPWPSGSTMNVSPGGGCNADVCIRGSAAFLLLGANIGAVGDFDNDGFDDLAITALGAGGFAGQVYVILGRAETDLPREQLIELPVGVGDFDVEGFTVEGSLGLKQLGTSIAGLADMDGDGRADLALGASGSDPSNGTNPTDDVTGEVRYVAGTDYGSSTGLVSLGNGTLIMEDVPGASASSFGFTAWMANVGNFDGEGDNELAVFSPGWVDDDGIPGLSAGDTILDDGRVLMFLGDGALSNGTPRVTFSNDLADSANDQFGLRISTGWHPTLSEAGFLLSDFDDDGLSDLLIDSVETGTGPANSYLFYGYNDAVDRVRSSAEVTLPAFTTAPNYARAVGDINNDGYPDLLIVDNGVAHLLF
jgi:hypothetical protein